MAEGTGRALGPCASAGAGAVRGARAKVAARASREGNFSNQIALQQDTKGLGARC